MHFIKLITAMLKMPLPDVNLIYECPCCSISGEDNHAGRDRLDDDDDDAGAGKDNDCNVGGR